MPAAGDGTSIVALSVSSVTSGSSAATVSPGLTSTSMTGDVLEVADVGDLDFDLCHGAPHQSNAAGAMSASIVREVAR